MAGFDSAWRQGKVLVCSLTGPRQRVRVWCWCAKWDVQTAAYARYVREVSKEPTWVERYGEPAMLPEHPRGFESYR